MSPGRPWPTSALLPLGAHRCGVGACAGWNVEADGLFGAPPITVIVGAEAHPSVTKSLGLLGLGRSRVIKVSTDSQGRDEGGSFSRDRRAHDCLFAGSGNVNTGSFDPADEIVGRSSGCRSLGACGRRVLPLGRRSSVEEKLMLVRESWKKPIPGRLMPTSGSTCPTIPGLALVRDPHALRAAMAITAEYLPTESDQRNPADFTPEVTGQDEARGS